MGIGGPSDEFPNLSAPYPRRSILIPDRVIAGWLAGVVMKGGGYGVIVDVGSEKQSRSDAAPIGSTTANKQSKEFLAQSLPLLS